VARRSPGSPAAQDPSWPAYKEAVLEFRIRDPFRVWLAEPVVPADRDQLVALTPSGTFAVVTPFNPHGRKVSAAENEARLRQQEAELAALGLPHLRVDGLAPDGNHCEEGYAIDLPRAEARALAQRWGQSALFWFDGVAFWLVPAEVTAEPVRLPAD
jgi:hypothetical protein